MFALSSVIFDFLHFDIFRSVIQLQLKLFFYHQNEDFHISALHC